MFLLPAFAVYGLLYSLAPNATDYLAQVTLVVTMSVREFELASYAYTHHSTDLINFSDYALTEVERSLRQYSAADAALYSAPIGAYLWDSSPSLQHYTHAAGSYAHIVSDIARTAASQVVHTSFGLRTLNAPLVPAPFVKPIFNPLYNISSVAHGPLRPTFGPEWEWTPHDLVIWVPPPACPAPILTSNMSTASGIGKCGLGPERYMPMEVAAFPLPPLPAPGSYDLFDTLEALDMLRSPAAPYSPQPADPSGILGWLSMALATAHLVRMTWCYFKALVLFGPVGDVLCRRFFSNFNKCEEEYGLNLVARKHCLDTGNPAFDLLDVSDHRLSVMSNEISTIQPVALEATCDSAAPGVLEANGKLVEAPVSKPTVEHFSPGQAIASTPPDVLHFNSPNMLSKPLATQFVAAQATSDSSLQDHSTGDDGLSQTLPTEQAPPLIMLGAVAADYTKLPIESSGAKLVEDVNEESIKGDVEAAPKVPIETGQTIAHDEHGNHQPYSKESEHSALDAREDIVESTHQLSADLACHSREDRTHRAAPTTNIDGTTLDANRDGTKTKKKRGGRRKAGAGSGNKNGGGNGSGSGGIQGGATNGEVKHVGWRWKKK
ncbi:hypothetical protein BDV93DRAFT_364416 [Ceratobasidium sp. AG-I]|nr:hypothetical protein BDV93DRAFT_364416 [Ceratobasidium sp. AG-I]